MSTPSERRLNIAVIGGDGTGPEVAAEGVKVLQAVTRLEGIAFSYQEFDYGGDRYLRTGEVLPPGALDELARFDAILLGAIGHPDGARASWNAACCWPCGFTSTSTSISGR